MKGRVLIMVLALVVTLLESYFRLQDPTNYFRPTVVLQRLDSQLTDILTQVYPYLQDAVAVVGHSIHLVLRPFYGSLLVAGEIISKVFAHTPPNDLVLYLYFSTWCVIAVYCTYDGIQKDARSIDTASSSSSTPIYAKMLSEGNVLKLQGEVQRLKLQNQRLGKELDRMCALLKKEGAGVTF